MKYAKVAIDWGIVILPRAEIKNKKLHPIEQFQLTSNHII